jgi:hypothetical protein
MRKHSSIGGDMLAEKEDVGKNLIPLQLPKQEQK